MKPFQGDNQRKFKGLIFCGLMMTSVFANAQLQNTQDEGANAQDSDVPKQAEQAPPEGAGNQAKPAKKTPEKRTLYFVGPKLPSQRQQGPSIGAPTSILPKPMVAKGSIAVPSPQDLTPDPASGLVPEPDSDEGPTRGATPLRIVDPLGERDPSQPDGADANLARVQATDNPVDGDQSGIQEGILEQIDPSGLPVAGLANPIDTIWQGYDRAAIGVFLQRLSRPSFSPTLTRLASAIAGSRFSLPSPSDQDDIIEIIEARLAVFEATANAEAYVSLLDGLPVDGNWSALASHTARAHLLKGELTDACLIADAERVDDANPYWVRLAAFCMAADGNRTGVDFQLGILEETTRIEPVFYQLLDQILIEAEQPPGAVISDPVTIEGGLQTDILTVAMARLSRAKILEIDAKDLNPLAIPMLLENPSLSTEAQSMLVAYLLERGIGEGAAMAAFARSFILQDGEIDAALAASASDAPDSPSETAIEEAPQDLDTQGVDGAVLDENRLQAILLAVIGGAAGEDQRLLALEQFWNRTAENGKLVVAAPVLSALTPNSSFEDIGQISPRVQGYLARAAMLATDRQAADSWSRQLRTSVAGQNVDVDNALIALWPLLAVGEESAPEDSANRLGLWWRQQFDGPEAFKRANLLFSLTDATDGYVSEELWNTLVSGPAAFDGVIISTALWRKFEMDVQVEDPVAALTSLYQLLGEVGPSDLPPAISGVLVSGLMRLGFEDTAKALALEIMISQKL